jgi:superfamily II DNA or RNA helicase
VRRDEIQAKWVANQIALKRAIEKTGASKVITFHSRVNLAEDFAGDDARGFKEHVKGFDVFHVNGSQNAADRKALLEGFKAAPKGLITNARCLTEGVDVPAVDMVAFVDPRKSKIDIAQAAGRAMRQSKATSSSPSSSSKRRAKPKPKPSPGPASTKWPKSWAPCLKATTTLSTPSRSCRKPAAAGTSSTLGSFTRRSRSSGRPST